MLWVCVNNFVIVTLSVCVNNSVHMESTIFRRVSKSSLGLFSMSHQLFDHIMPVIIPSFILQTQFVFKRAASVCEIRSIACAICASFRTEGHFLLDSSPVSVRDFGDAATVTIVREELHFAR
jgi:hypothetical protein